MNALSVEVRKGLLDALKESEKKESIEAIILKGSGKTFPAGADIKEFGSPPQNPGLPIINDYIENCFPAPSHPSCADHVCGGFGVFW